MKNWTTFQRMKVSAAEVEDYLVRIAKNVVVETIRQYSGLLESDVSGLEKHREFLLYPKNLEAESRFQAYVYSLDRRKGQNEPIFSALDTLFQSLSEPKDFVLKINDPEIGYYYTKKLSPSDRTLSEATDQCYGLVW